MARDRSDRGRMHPERYPSSDALEHAEEVELQPSIIARALPRRSVQPHSQASRDLAIGLTIVAFAAFVAVVVLYPSRLSTGWALCFFFSALVVSAHVWTVGVLRHPPSVPRWLVLVLALAWGIAGALAAASRAARLAAAPSNADDLTDLLFSLCCLLSMSVAISWLTRPQIKLAYAMRARAHTCARRTTERPTCCCCCCELCCAVLSSLAIALALLACFDAAATLARLASQPVGEFVYLDRGEGGGRYAIHYWCDGAVRHDAIAVLEAGFMMPDPGMAWFQAGLAQRLTRTCVFDRAGFGLSQRAYPDVGFAADARAMRAVLEREFEAHERGSLAAAQQAEAAGAPANATSAAASAAASVGGKRVAIVGGHSRGHLSAVRFHLDQRHAYSRVLVVSIDGSSCDPRTDDLLRRFVGLSEAQVTYAAAPLMSLAAGGLRLLWPLLRGFALTGGMSKESERLPPVALPAEAEEAYLATMVRSNYWRRDAASSHAWRESYDGPTTEQCERLGVRRYVDAPPPACGAPCTDWLGIAARFTCVDAALRPVARAVAVGCAGHVSLVTARHFADVAVGRIACFVAERLGDDARGGCTHPTAANATA